MQCKNNTLQQIESVALTIDLNKEILVFEDTYDRKETRGFAKYRGENTFGFITMPEIGKYYTPDVYESIFYEEILRLQQEILTNPNKTFRITRLGMFSNKYGIYEEIIFPKLPKFIYGSNVKYDFVLTLEKKRYVGYKKNGSLSVQVEKLYNYKYPIITDKIFAYDNLEALIKLKEYTNECTFKLL